MHFSVRSALTSSALFLSTLACSESPTSAPATSNSTSNATAPTVEHSAKPTTNKDIATDKASSAAPTAPTAPNQTASKDASAQNSAAAKTNAEPASAAKTGGDKSAVDKPSAKPASDEPRGLRHKEDGAFDGYTVIAPQNSRSIFLVDMDGKVVHTWKTAHNPGGATHLLDNGLILRCARRDESSTAEAGAVGGIVQEIDWDGNVVWEYGDVTQHHDLQILPNGNVLLIGREFLTADEGLALGRDPVWRENTALWSDIVVEVEPVRPSGGKIVWQWRASDHLVQEVSPKQKGYGKPADFPGRIDINADHRYKPKTETDEQRKKREALAAKMKSVGYTGGEELQAAADPKTAAKPARVGEDWLHLNAVDYLPEHDLIALSTPRLSELWVIDHSTTTAEAATSKGGKWGHGGELLYRWGNARSYGMATEEERDLYYQHDVTWQRGSKPGELRALCFNNGQRRPGGEYSSVEEIVLPFDAKQGFVRDAKRAFGPEKPVWIYSDPAHFYSGFIAGAQRLPNGNTLICEGAKGRVFEVRPDGHIVWDFWNPNDGEQTELAPPMALFIALRVPKDSPAVRGKL